MSLERLSIAPLSQVALAAKADRKTASSSAGPAFSSRKAFLRSIPPRSKRQILSRPSGPSRSRSQPRQKGSETGVMKPRRVPSPSR